VASFVWMPLTEPTYKRTRLCRSRLASEDSEPEGTAQPITLSRLGLSLVGLGSRVPTRARGLVSRPRRV